MRLLIPAAVMLVYACGASTPEPASAPTPALDSGSRVEDPRSEEHTSELQSRLHLVCRLLLEKKKKRNSQSRSFAPLHQRLCFADPLLLFSSAARRCVLCLTRPRGILYFISVVLAPPMTSSAR